MAGAVRGSRLSVTGDFGDTGHYNRKVNPWLIAILYCLLGAMAEGVAAGRSPRVFLKNLVQPRWAVPQAAWYVIAILYYAICFATGCRIVMLGPRRTPVLVSLAAVMLLNAAWNAIFFRAGALRASLLFYIPYAGAVAALIWLLWPVDRLAAWSFVVYAAIYLPYAVAWSYSLVRLNARA